MPSNSTIDRRVSLDPAHHKLFQNCALFIDTAGRNTPLALSLSKDESFGFRNHG